MNTFELVVFISGSSNSGFSGLFLNRAHRPSRRPRCPAPAPALPRSAPFCPAPTTISNSEHFIWDEHHVEITITL